jgi:hypothetical protein
MMADVVLHDELHLCVERLGQGGRDSFGRWVRGAGRNQGHFRHSRHFRFVGLDGWLRIKVKKIKILAKMLLKYFSSKSCSNY